MCDRHWSMMPPELQEALRFRTARVRNPGRALLRAVSIVQSEVDGWHQPCTREGCDLMTRPGREEPLVCLVCYHDINPALRRTLRLLYNKGSPLPGYAEAIASAVDQFKGT